MSSLGRTVSQVRKSSKYRSSIIEEKSFPIGIQTPVEPGYKDNETLFKMHFDPLEQIKDNLKNLILTQKGERLGYPDFGTNINRIYSNTNLSEDQIADIVMNEITYLVAKYMPSLTLQNFYSSKIKDENNKTNDPNITGLNYAQKTSNISLNSASINKESQISSIREKVYKITVEYTVQSLTDVPQNIVLFIKTST
jgi:phage baseplate assembly protein W